MKVTKFSIIVPHKNSFDLLLRLINTVPKSSDFEVIIVDDNSDFDVRENLKNFEFEHNIITIFNETPGGAGKARNLGLKRATGKWLMFADADDFFSENMQTLVTEHFDSFEDIIYFGTYSVYNKDLQCAAYRHPRYMSLVSNFIDNKDTEDALRYYFTPPWGKMIRRRLVEDNNLSFEEILASNDMLFSLSTAYHAKKVSAVKDVIYIITVTEGSLTNSYNKLFFDTKFKAALRANEYLRSIDKNKYQQSVLYFLAKSYSFGIKYMIYVIKNVIQHRSNLLIGLDKIFTYSSVLNQRENPNYMKKK